ncbi:MAG: DUF6268 family outer membrane beta-barrel protein [Verrucomicrobia bacterium]|nr:DUF6268 family outer membrane beta-barrel protein [Verrucomicrobiota bacterium]
MNNRVQKYLLSITAMISGLCLAVPGNAQAEEAVTTVMQASARAGIGYLGSASVRGVDSKLDGHFHRANIDFVKARGRDWRFGFGLQTLLVNADWSAPIPVAGNLITPYEKIDEFGLSAFGFYALNERWGVQSFGSLSFARGYQGTGIEAMSLSKTDTYNVGVLLTYAVNPQLRISAGVIAGTRLEQSDLFIPVFSVRYTANEHWTIRLFEASGIDNLDIAGVDYDVSGDGRLRVSGSVQWANYSVGLGTLRDATGRRVAVEDRAYRLLLGLTYTFPRGLFLQPYAGYDAHRTMRFMSDRVELADYRLRNGWLIGVNGGLRF